MAYYIASLACLLRGIGLIGWTQITEDAYFKGTGALFFLGVLLAIEGFVGTLMYWMAISS